MQHHFLSSSKMLYGLVCVTWCEMIVAILPFLTTLALQLLNTSVIKSTSTLRIEGKEVKLRNAQTTASVALSTEKAEICGEEEETKNNGDNDEEDTLSLENLFPCDQTEIYASKNISFIIDELLQTEANYINNLRKGLHSYGHLQQMDNLPEQLRGGDKSTQLLGNIEEILALHEEKIMPMMLRNQRDLHSLFDEFSTYFDKNNFYCYVIFTMNKKTSMQLRNSERLWFQQLQTKLKDKLGIDSFLVQPIQRLTRYPLMLQQFIKEFYKSGISCKPVLVSVCKLETRMRRLIEVVNQSEEIPSIEEIKEVNIIEQGNFLKSTEFDAYYTRSRKKIRTKVFLFDRCLVCTEMRKRRLTYRCHYNWDTIDIQLNTSKSVTLLQKQCQNGVKSVIITKDQVEFSNPDSISVKQWVQFVRKIIETSNADAEWSDKFSLPMDLILGVAVAVWFIWQYMY